MPAPTATGLGRIGYVGASFGTANTWGTEVAISGAKLFPAWFTPGNGTPPGMGMVSGSGEKFLKGVFWQDIKCTPSLKFQCSFEGFGHLLASAIQADSVSGPTDTTAYTHTMDIFDGVSKTFGSIAAWAGNTNGTVQSVVSAMPEEISFDLKPGAACEVEIKYLADRIINNSSTNTAATLAGLTVPGATTFNEKIMLWHGSAVTAGYFRINTQGGGALASTDEFFPSGCKITIKRKLKGTQGPSRFIRLPVDEGQPEVEFEFDLPIFEGNAADPNGVNWQLFQDMQTLQGGTNVEKKLEIYLESKTLAGAATVKYSTKFQSPRGAVVLENPNMGGPGPLPAKLKYTAMEAFTAPTGMSGVTVPLRTIFVDKTSGAYLS